MQTRLQHETNLKKIIQHLTENVVESDIQNRMQPLRNILIRTIDQLHTIVEPNVFLAICRGFWDRMGQVKLYLEHFIFKLFWIMYVSWFFILYLSPQDILHSLENRRENRSYKGLRIAVSVSRITATNFLLEIEFLCCRTDSIQSYKNLSKN